ncbi:LacI family transcriptional regulator [Christensenellaceae bacterium OttesenSCG-928-L17]|nr:LacI family transcriptional regulator [Christensenellaceae bacterium OttesenSCG-928-L17]
MKQVTIKDVAKVAGVSYATVSRALSGSPEIGEATRQRILKICDEMGYTANSVARSLVARQTKIIGLIVGSVNNPFMSEIAYYLEEQVRNRGYNLMLCNSANDLSQELETFRLLRGRQVDGIIIVPTNALTYERLKPYLSNMPTVFVSENLRDLPESYVTIDNTRGTYLGMEHLYALGHRKIVYFGRRIGSLTHQLRATGYENACRDYGLEPHFVDSYQTSSAIHHGYKYAKEFFAQKQHEQFTAMLASTDTIALGIMQAADEFGLSVPNDFSLVGFDNITYSSLPKINLTTIDQPKEAIASVAIDMLLEKLRAPHIGYSHRIMMPSLIVRKSTAPIPVQDEA